MSKPAAAQHLPPKPDAPTDASPPTAPPADAPPSVDRAIVREQLHLLMLTSFCPKVHDAKRPRPPSFSKALDERRKEATVYEGDYECADCQKKLAPVSAALVLLVLGPTPNDRLVAAAKELRARQPMTWAAIQRAHVAQLEQALRRCGSPRLTSFEYQARASDLVATLRD